MFSGAIVLNNAEMVPMYRLLKRFESELEPELLQILMKIEKLLYENLSIEEIERLG